jgi:hypothetical protein
MILPLFSFISYVFLPLDSIKRSEPDTLFMTRLCVERLVEATVIKNDWHVQFFQPRLAKQNQPLLVHF